MGFFRVLYILGVSNSLKCPILVNRQNSNILGKLGDFVKFYGKIPDILVLITGHFGLFKTTTLRLGEAGTIQTQSQTWRLRKAKINFKSVRKTIFNLPEVSENNQTMRFFTSVTSHQINGLFTIGCIFFLFLFESVRPIFCLFLPVIYKSCL